MPRTTETALTQKIVDSLTSDGCDHFIWDPELRGFGIRMKPSGVASYVIQYRNSDRRTRRLAFAKTTALTLKQARLEARKRLAKVVQGGDPSADRHAERKALTISGLGDYFLDVYGPERKLSRRYLRDCRSLLNHVIIPRWGQRKVKAVTRDDVRRLKIDMRGTPIRTNRCLALLSKMFSLAIEQGERTDNPCIGIERNQENKRDQWFGLNDIETLMHVLAKEEDQHQANGIRLLFLTGARVGEVVSAEWSHFDLDRGMWIKPPSKTKQRRVHRAPLSSGALEILWRMLASRDVSSPYLFPSPKDPAGSHRGDFHKFWRSVRDKAALGNARLYDARHTYASHLIVNGVPLGVIGALLGHSQPATTARYAHVGDTAARAATQKMGDILQDIRESLKERDRAAAEAAALVRVDPLA